MMRRVARTYSPFYRERGVRISQQLAEAQFDAYAKALRAAGLRVHFVEADDDFPDCVFVEDPAVVWPPRALMTRMTPHREGEQLLVEAALLRWHEIERLPPGARLEGGDVLHVGDTTYVGLTKRTNEEGIQALRDFMGGAGRRVVKVPVNKSLHLKSAVTYLGDGVLLAAPGLVETGSFEVDDVLLADASEPRAANCLRVNDRLLIPQGYPKTERRLRDFAEHVGAGVLPLDISEFEKGDGSVTCLCLVW